MNELVSEVGFEQVGAMMIMADYLNKINIINTIDEIVEPLRSNHRRLSHGQTCFILILFFIFRPRAVYKVIDWVEETTYLKTIFPNIISEHFTEDRIQDTLDAVHKAGASNIFSSQSIEIIKNFNLNTDQIHVDLTNFSVSGDYQDNEAFEVTYGHSKSGRDDLKQFALEAGVTSEGVPIVQTTLSGNTADVNRYIPMWLGIKNVLGSSDFLLIGDCKLTSEENLLTICRGNGYYVGPMSMYKNTEKELRRLVIEEKMQHKKLLEIKKSESKTVLYEGFEVEGSIKDEKTQKTYLQRKVYVLSSQLRETQLKSLEERLRKTKEEIGKIEEFLNKKKYKTKEKIEESIVKTIKKHKIPENIIEFKVIETKEMIKKNKKAGKPTKNSETIEIEDIKYGIEVIYKDDEIEIEKKLCGYFILATNKKGEDLTTEQVLESYKQEWKVERIFSRLKGQIQTLPVYLKLTRRIEALMYLLMTCAQIFTLIDLEAKRTLEQENTKLEGLFPKGITTARPKTEYMFDAMRNIGLVYQYNGIDFSVAVTGISKLQADILRITKTDLKYTDTKNEMLPVFWVSLNRIMVT